MRNPRGNSSKIYKEIYLHEKKERLLQTLLILMGLVIAGHSLNSNNDLFPSSYYIAFFIFITTTVFSYSDLCSSFLPRKAVLILNLIIASSFSFVLVFFFAYDGIFSISYGVTPIIFSFMTIILWATISEGVEDHTVNYHKIESFFYLILVIVIFLVFIDAGMDGLHSKLGEMTPLITISLP